MKQKEIMEYLNKQEVKDKLNSGWKTTQIAEHKGNIHISMEKIIVQSCTMVCSKEGVNEVPF